MKLAIPSPFSKAISSLQCQKKCYSEMTNSDLQLPFFTSEEENLLFIPNKLLFQIEWATSL